jgi:ribonucleoside-diphosphate reductase alpha chain
MQLDKQILSEITVHTKYAKFLPEQERRESWQELVTRNRDMHLRKFPELAEEIKNVYDKFVYTKKILPSMRWRLIYRKHCLMK